ncbi:hypothetical protein U1Q18_046707 [Sarracenia purpurea var. burkii]
MQFFLILPEFDMRKGKKALIAMLKDIETNYLYFDSDDEEDEAKRPNFGDIYNAETVDGNQCLLSDQDQELVDLNVADRVELRDFNLEKGKKALIAMLEDIENNYLYFDSDDSEDDRKRPNLECTYMYKEQSNMQLGTCRNRRISARA